MASKKQVPRLVFIAEDNTMYAKTVQMFLKNKFPQIETVIFPVGELVLDNLDRKPDMIIMDYFLNSKYYDAANGKEIVEELKAKAPDMDIILLSSQQDIEVALEIKDLGCEYIVKNDESLEKIENYINKLS